MYMYTFTVNTILRAEQYDENDALLYAMNV